MKKAYDRKPNPFEEPERSQRKHSWMADENGNRDKTEPGGVGGFLKERFQDAVLTVTPVFQCLLIFFTAVLFVGIPAVLLFTNLKTLGIFWIPVLIVYWTFLSVVARQVVRRKEMMVERFLYGDELFFQVYPHFKRVEERKMRRKAWLERHLLRR